MNARICEENSTVRTLGEEYGSLPGIFSFKWSFFPALVRNVYFCPIRCVKNPAHQGKVGEAWAPASPGVNSDRVKASGGK